SAASDDHPCVSSITNYLPVAGFAWTVVYERTLGSHDHLYGQAFSGTTSLTGTMDLSTLLGASANFNQQMPCVDSDGCRFAIGYRESCGLICQDAVPNVATVHLESGSTFGLTEAPVTLNYYAGPDLLPRITSTRSGGGAPTRYFLGWHVQSLIPPDVGANGAL